MTSNTRDKKQYGSSRFAGSLVGRFNADDGASLAEYALLLVLIAVPVAVFLPPLANAIAAIFFQLAGAF